MSKRIMAFVLALVVAGMPWAAMAEEAVAYDIGYLSISLPEDFDVHTRKYSWDGGANQDDVGKARDYFIAHPNVFLQGYHAELDYEILISVNPSMIHADFRNESSEEFHDQIRALMADALRDHKATVTEEEFILIPNINSSSQRIFFRPALSLSAHRSAATTRSSSAQDEKISRCFGRINILH